MGDNSSDKSTVTVVSFICDNVGGFDWFWKREDALKYWDECKDEPELYSEIWLFTYTSKHTHTHPDYITDEIDQLLAQLEDNAEQHLVLRERTA